MNEIISSNAPCTDSLTQELRGFGLNPKHWRVFCLSPYKAAAVHVSDELVLLGSLSQVLGQPQWSDLEIYESDEIFAAQI